MYIFIHVREITKICILFVKKVLWMKKFKSTCLSLQLISVISNKIFTVLVNEKNV